MATCSIAAVANLQQCCKNPSENWNVILNLNHNIKYSTYFHFNYFFFNKKKKIYFFRKFGDFVAQYIWKVGVFEV